MVTKLVSYPLMTAIQEFAPALGDATGLRAGGKPPTLIPLERSVAKEFDGLLFQLVVETGIGFA
jgi:hypothetical protein